MPALYCDLRGEGAPLLLVHGMLGCHENWSLVFPDVPDGYRIVAPDLPGHGASPRPSSFSFRDASRAVMEMLDELGIDQTQAIGVSGGAQVLLHIATLEPSRISELVMVSCGPRFPAEARAFMNAYTVASRSESEWNEMRAMHPGGDDQVKWLWQSARALKDSYDDVNFSTGDLGRIEARTLIVHGDSDPLYPLTIAEEMNKAIADAELLVVPGAGHSPIFGAEMPEIKAHVMSFLSTPST